MIEVIIPRLLNSLVDRRVWESATPDSMQLDANGDLPDFLLWSLMGGTDSEYVDQAMPEMSHARIQLHAYSKEASRAGALLKAARDRLLASEYSVGVYGSPLGAYDEARKLKVRYQQFGIHYPQ